MEISECGGETHVEVPFAGVETYLFDCDEGSVRGRGPGGILSLCASGVQV